MKRNSLLKSIKRRIVKVRSPRTKVVGKLRAPRPKARKATTKIKY